MNTWPLGSSLFNDRQNSLIHREPEELTPVLYLLDINECANVTDCSPDATCSNTFGSFNCVCKTGYQGNGKQCG